VAALGPVTGSRTAHLPKRTSVLTSEFGWVQVITDAYGRHQSVRVLYIVLKLAFEQSNSANYLWLLFTKSYYNSRIYIPVSNIARNSTN
jgi:hypothetical protein